MSDVAVEILLIVGLVVLNGFFAGSEAAMIAIRRSHVAELAARGGKRAALLLKLKHQPETFLATVQIGVTVVSTLAAVFSGATIALKLSAWLSRVPNAFIADAAPTIAIGTVVVAISGLSLIVGELVPKYVALSHPGPVSLFSAYPIRALTAVFYPLVKLLTVTARGIAGMLGSRPAAGGPPVTEHEIKHIATEGQRAGAIDETEQSLIHAVLDFTDTQARQIMCPRPEVDAVDESWERDRVLRFVAEHGFSRYPVFRDDIDHIIGVLHTKDAVRVMVAGGAIIVADMVRPAVFVPDSLAISQVLVRLQSERRRMAVVLDEFGGTAGIVTIEDIIEELVGEIEDEFDALSGEFHRLRDGSALVAGLMPVADFNDEFDCEMPTDRAETVGGLVTAYLERLPARGDSAEIMDVQFRVLRLKGRRIDQLKAVKTATPSPNTTP